MDNYEKASGAAANYVKTQGILLGTWRNKPPPTDKIQWREHVKALGVWHGYNIDNNKIWNEKISKIKKNLKMWEKRNLTFDGRILLIKALGISVVGYEAQMKGMPNQYIKPIKNILFEFLWNKKTPLVNKEAVCLPKTKGGLNMLDLENFLKIKQIKWIDSIIESAEEEWNIIAKYWLQQWDERGKLKYFITTHTSLDKFELDKIPKFYKEALIVWSKFRQDRCTSSKDEILNENIFGNNIVTSATKSLMHYVWLQSNIRQIKDIWDLNNHTWITERNLLVTLQQKRNWMAQFLSIRNSVPKEWLHILRGEKPEVCEKHKLKISD